MALVVDVHQLVRRLPATERRALASQMTRASRSVPTNIAEGYAKRRSAKEFCAYLTTAMGSANEMEVHLKIAADCGYLEAPEYDTMAAQYSTVGKQLNRLIAAWQGGPPSAVNQQLATSN